MLKTNKPYKVHDDVNDVKIEQKFLPLGLNNRSGEHQNPEFIVIHEVSLGIGRSPEEYNMEHYAKKILQDGINGSKIGYHYLVGSNAIFQFIPDDEITCHTGTDYFNSNSIGIERVICSSTYYPNALHNQAKLAATLMLKHNIPINNVISHKSCRIISGNPKKECPGRLIAGQYGGFKAFYNEIKKCIHERDLFFEILYDNIVLTDESQILKKEIEV